MTILITGGTGLVGSRLLPRLRDAGLDCRALVRPGKDVPPGVSAIEGDILRPETLNPAVDGVTAVIHLAALFRGADADAIWQANVEGTRNLLTATRQHAPEARFVFASTARVYAPDLPRPAREDDPVAGGSPYPKSKIAAEEAVLTSELNWSVLRFGFVYGDGDGHIQAAPGQLAAWGWHPAKTLSLVHHRDIATVVHLALTGALDHRVVNVVDESPVTSFEPAQVVTADHPGSNEPVIDPWDGHVDGSLLRSLGFEATVPTVYQAARENAL